MAQRITEAMLEAQVERLNRVTLNESKPVYGTMGAYHLDYAYGGVRLEKTVKGGISNTVLNTGYVPKPELYKAISAFINGISEGLNIARQTRIKES